MNCDAYGYRDFMRLSSELSELMDRVGTSVQKEKTIFHEPLPTGLKIAITLRYLATA